MLVLDTRQDLKAWWSNTYLCNARIHKKMAWKSRLRLKSPCTTFFLPLFFFFLLVLLLPSQYLTIFFSLFCVCWPRGSLGGFGFCFFYLVLLQFQTKSMPINCTPCFALFMPIPPCFFVLLLAFFFSLFLHALAETRWLPKEAWLLIN